MPPVMESKVRINQTLAEGHRPEVLIGPLSDDPTESVSAVNRTLIQGMAGRYHFASLPATRRFGNTRQASINGMNAYYFAEQLVQWTMNLFRKRPDIAHYAISSGWAMEKGLAFMRVARCFGAKTVGHLHSGGFIDHWQSLPEWRRRLASRELRMLDGFVVLSEGWRKNISEKLGFPSDKLFVVNNPIDQGFEDAALQMPIERSGNIVLSLGAMCKEKGVIETLEAATIARSQAKFKIQFVGPEREPGIHQRTREYVANHSLADVIDIKSSVWGPDKIQLFAEASIFLLPSYFENFPLVLLEAAAAGLAIVTTPVGAVPEFFKDGVSALFIEVGNAKQIADAIVSLAENPERRLRLGRAARDVFKSRLARSNIMNSLDQVYQNVLSRNCH